MDSEEFEALTTEEAFRKKVLDQLNNFHGKFDEVNARLSNQDLAMTNQNLAIAQNTALTQKISDETKGVREFMSNGADAAKLFCRLAAAWRFMWKWVIVAVGGPIVVLYSFFYYAVHGSFPPWFTAIASIFVK